MEREILFRGKDIETGEWREGYYSHQAERDYIEVRNSLDTASILHWVNEDTVGQFTGIRDSKGKRIYEGDIVLYKGNKNEIICEDGAFKIRNRTQLGEYKQTLCSLDSALEVIGNIHDNPELLRQQNRHYKFTGETMEFNGHTLHRIIATEGFDTGHGKYIWPDSVGGWIEKPENLQDNAWVDNRAMVFGDAVIKDKATVMEDAIIGGNAVVTGDAQVYGGAVIYGHAKVEGNTQVYGNARVHGHAVVCSTARVFDNAEVCGTAQVRGARRVCGNEKVDAVIRKKKTTCPKIG